MDINRLSPQEFKKVENMVNNFNLKMKKSRVNKDEMGKNEFLKILTVQLSHQNPLQPMDNTQFISQMAQFSSLEQMQNINQTLKNLQGDFTEMKGAGLIGNQAKYTDENGNVVEGKVEEVQLKNKKVVIDGTEVAIADLLSVKAANHFQPHSQPASQHARKYDEHAKITAPTNPETVSTGQVGKKLDIIY